MSFPRRKKVTRNLDWEEDRVLLSDFICSRSQVAVKKEEKSFFLILEHKDPNKSKKKKRRIPHFREVKTFSKIKVRDMLTPRRRQWHPTPVLLSGKSHGWKSLVGCSPRGC